LLDASAGDVDRTAKPSELLDPPREADLLVRGDQLVILTVGLALHHDIERGRLASSMRLGVLDDNFELPGRRSLRVPNALERRKHAVEATCSAERLPRRPSPPDPNRGSGPLDRRGQEQALSNAVVLALVGKRLATPQPTDDVESLVDQLVTSARFWILAKRGELLPGL
jgi:hypothetical protein